MFIIASTGRCGTLALCEALNEASDHFVEHEPEPRLLYEAFLKHRGAEYDTPTLRERIAFFHERAGSRYGQTFRAATLLPELLAAAPETRFLVFVRPPLEYILSAHYMRVFERGDEWDAHRIVPDKAVLESASLAQKLAMHWIEINRYLLDFAELNDAVCRVTILGSLENDVHEWAQFLGVKVTDQKRLLDVLRSRPNASLTHERPDGFDEASLTSLTEAAFRRAQSLARR